MRNEIEACIREQEELGLDVLVHGEFERTDMVEYFGEQLDGFFTTANGWVQSYGSRCVKPRVLYGDVVRREPMTVEWASFAAGLTDRPVKGMLTGPVTMLQWAAAPSCRPGGLLAWATEAFRLATSSVPDQIQIHTHMCYAEFGEIIGAIVDLDADVISMEASRSQMELLDGFASRGYPNEIGPGIWDIHSPRVPGDAELDDLLARAVEAFGADRLWVNPTAGSRPAGGTRHAKHSPAW